LEHAAGVACLPKELVAVGAKPDVGDVDRDSFHHLVLVWRLKKRIADEAARKRLEKPVDCKLAVELANTAFKPIGFEQQYFLFCLFQLRKGAIILLRISFFDKNSYMLPSPFQM
jgi:hypothetical protein